MKYKVECLVDEYVSCAADLFVAKKLRLPNLTFLKKGQGAVFNSAKEYEPYARGFSGLAQMKKVMITMEPNGPEPKKDIEVTLDDIHHVNPSKKIEEPLPNKVEGMDVPKSEVKKVVKKIELPKEAKPEVKLEAAKPEIKPAS